MNRLLELTTGGSGLAPGRSAPTLQVVLGSTSPAKRRAVESAVRAAYAAQLGASPAAPEDVVKLESVAAASGVPDQPWGDDETRRGAEERARQARLLAPHAALAFGIEGGVQDVADGSLWAFAWVVVLGADGRAGTARSTAFPLPEQLSAAVRTGVELGDALDAAYGLTRAKDGAGAVGVLTGGLMDRAELYRPAVLLALIPWLAPNGEQR